MIFWYIISVLALAVLTRIAFTLVSIDMSLAALACHVPPGQIKEWLESLDSRKEDGA